MVCYSVVRFCCRADQRQRPPVKADEARARPSRADHRLATCVAMRPSSSRKHHRARWHSFPAAASFCSGLRQARACLARESLQPAHVQASASVQTSRTPKCCADQRCRLLRCELQAVSRGSIWPLVRPSRFSQSHASAANSLAHHLSISSCVCETRYQLEGK